ncbi:hypothetical protein DFH09DRAFT_1324053 [Mycena vulgaris]|nr:hypothetical protein DFH09DRAFT_1330658 [Mycena vulgaris]KAJ6538184.1 hypothetical protein DFH09DRAFT_1324053 [Mycena vulgaris]
MPFPWPSRAVGALVHPHLAPHLLCCLTPAWRTFCVLCSPLYVPQPYAQRARRTLLHILADTAPHRADAHAYAHVFTSARVGAAAARLYTGADASAYTYPHRCGRRRQASDPTTASHFAPLLLRFLIPVPSAFALASISAPGGYYCGPARGSWRNASRSSTLRARRAPSASDLLVHIPQTSSHPSRASRRFSPRPVLHGYLSFTLTLTF